MSIETNPECFLNNKDKIRVKSSCQCSDSNCQCVYEHGSFEWTWDKTLLTPRVQFNEKKMEVLFHPGYSNGTAAIRGNKFMAKDRHHYWEIQMVTPVYGTDVMVGVGTKKADLTSTVDSFCSLLGRDSESWGYSYKGYIQHRGETKEYTSPFRQGSSIGVHLDTWRGNVQFFLDRKPLGIAFTGLREQELYPMICSTAAKSKMRVTYSCSRPVSLQMECLSVLQPIQRAYLSAAFPGLKHLSKSVFADILKKEEDEDKEDDYEFPTEFLILDDFDFALIGCKKVRKKRRLNNYIPEVEFPRLKKSLKALVLTTN